MPFWSGCRRTGWRADNGILQIRRDQRQHLPRSIQIATDGQEKPEGIRAHYLGSPFRFCLHCGVSYSATQRSDFSKLASLSSEGRSTATTLLSLAAIRRLRGQTDLEVDARKLLSFTDNRQDASLQAGHFNDFIEITLLRSPCTPRSQRQERRAFDTMS